MSSKTASINLSYVARPGTRPVENRWLRLEQRRPEEKTLSLSEAAAAIDALFGIEPCSQGLGHGGEAAQADADGKPEKRPTEDKFISTMQERLGEKLCANERYWTAEVMVLTSRQSPAYAIKSESAELIRTVMVEEWQSESLEINGTSADLSWPYAGGLSVRLPPGIEAMILGSTLNLSASINGSLHLRYRSRYARATLRVPMETAQDDYARPEPQPAAVVAFWGELAASLELSEPEQDASASQPDAGNLCRKSSYSLEDSTPKNCFETVWHHTMCNCSRDIASRWHTIEPVQCPEGADSSSYFVANRSQFDGFVACSGDEDEVSEIDYYRKQCCTDPPQDKSLPRCRKTYAEYRGGAEIEGGPAKYVGLYGPSVRMVAVSPKGGSCGELVVEWDTSPRNCCDVAEPLEVDVERSGQVIAPSSSVDVYVLGGLPPYRWESAAPGLWFEDGLRRVDTYAPMVRVYSSSKSSEVCGTMQIKCQDACGGSIPIELRGSIGRWVLTETRRWDREYPSNVWHPDQSCPLSGAGTMLSDGVYELISGSMRLIERIDSCYEYTTADDARTAAEGCAACRQNVNSSNRQWPPCIAGNVPSGCRNPEADPCYEGSTCPTLCANCGDGISYFAWNRACGAYGWATACSGPQVIQRDIYEWRC